MVAAYCPSGDGSYTSQCSALGLAWFISDEAIRVGMVIHICWTIQWALILGDLWAPSAARRGIGGANPLRDRSDIQAFTGA